MVATVSTCAKRTDTKYVEIVPFILSPRSINKQSEFKEDFRAFFHRNMVYIKYCY